METQDGFYRLDEPGLLFKATPQTEGDRRFVYCEPSTENWDQQRERILRQALLDSADHFLKFGNIDTDHATMIGGKLGLSPEESRLREIGRPVEIIRGPKIVVRGEIYRGDTPAAKEANYFWSTLTEMTPPKRWYPSVGGRNAVRDCTDKGCVIKAFKWVNLGFAKEPVNDSVAPVGLDLDAFVKAITAGGGTDSASLAGGAALRRESLHPHPVTAVPGGEPRHRAAAAEYLRELTAGGRCDHQRPPHALPKLIEHFQRCKGMDGDQARRAAQTLIRAVADRVKARKEPAAIAA